MYIGENYLAIFPKKREAKQHKKNVKKKKHTVNVHTKMHYLDGCVEIFI